MQSGDVDTSHAVVWTRSDREATLEVTWWAEGPGGRRGAPRVVRGSDATAETDLTAKARLIELPSDARIVYEMELVAPSGARGPRVRGTLRTPPDPASRAPRDVVFAWSGDVVGQGFGIGRRLGMPAFAALAEAAPELFVHCGDAIYADNPVPETVSLHGGPLWENVVLPSKDHVAESLDDFRGAFLYPRHAEHFREAAARVPVAHVWDDHEVHDNWWPGQVLEDARYQERSVDVLAARARRAMFEHTPTLRDPSMPMYRAIRLGPHVELFLLDGRSYRTPNQPEPAEARFLGEVQLAWLVDVISRSRATWKVVASDMPLSLEIAEARRGGGLASDGIADLARGAPGGRELEIARLLAALHERRVRNLVWLGADVHYGTAVRLDPARARGWNATFTPFHELVAGPMHAGAFPQKPLDETFGPEVLWSSAGRDTFGSPADGRQNFGLVRVDGASGRFHVRWIDGAGTSLHELQLVPN